MIDLQALLDALRDTRSVGELTAYFRDTGPRYSGRRFNDLGHGPLDHPHEITATDILAVECLSVSVPTETAIDLLDGELGNTIAGLLRGIPADAELGVATAYKYLTHGKPADQAWDLLEEQDNVGWVTAGKLLARKRPALIPIWDNVLRCALGKPENGTVWLELDSRFRESHQAL